MKRLLLIFCFLILSVPACPQTLVQVQQNYFAGTQSIFLYRITHTSDLYISRKHLLYLLGFTPKKEVTFQDLQQAFNRLEKLNRFAAIDISLTKMKRGYHLHLELVGAWLLKNVVFKGSFAHDEKFRAAYDGRMGEKFDIKAHEKSCEMLKRLLQDHGYFYGQVNDLLEYDEKNKSIVVSISIDKGRRSTISDVTLQLYGIKEGKMRDDIFSKIETRLGKKYVGSKYSSQSVVQLKKWLKSLVRKFGYMHPTVLVKRSFANDSRDVSFMVRVKLHQQARVVFSGNSVFDSSTLYEKFIVDQPSWLITPSILREQIASLYARNGYPDCNVETVSKSDDLTTILIREGSPVYVNSISLIDSDGNKLAIPQSWTAMIGALFNDSAIQAMIDKMQQSYFDQGFVSCSFSFTVDEQGGQVAIFVTVDIGKREVIRAISFLGVDERVLNDLEKGCDYDTKQENVFLSPRWITQNKLKIHSVLHKHGYWYAQVDHNLIHDQSDVVDIEWVINVGKKVTFGKVILTGTSSVPFDKVKATLPFKTGDVWSDDIVQLTRSRLEQLGVFKHVKVRAYDIFNQEGQKDIVVALDDEALMEVRLRAGYFLTSKNFLFKRQSTYKAGGSFFLKNPSNAADMLTCAFEQTRFERRLDATYQRPHLFFPSIAGEIKGYSNKYVHPVQLGRSESAYEAEQHGVLVSVSNQYKKDYHWGFSCGHEWTRTSRIRGRLNLDPRLINRMLPYVFFEPSIVLDTVDDRLNPRIGGLTFASVKFMLPYKSGDVIYKAMVEQSCFYPVAPRITGAFRVRWGHIFRQRFDNIMPIDRFYLGGPHTVRGYEKDAFPPFGIECCTKHGKTHRLVTIQGGSSMFNINLELRIALFKSFGLVLFHDMGVLSQKGLSPFEGKWLPASGFGVRYHTPIGPIRFDLGHKWKREIPEQSSVVWYLTLGHAF